MRFAKKVAVAIDINQKPAEVLNLLKELPFLTQCEIHFVHVYFIMSMGYAMDMTALTYPIPSDRKIIEESILAHLRKVGKSYLPQNFEGKIIERCLFSEDPKSTFCDYVKDHHIDFVITATREKRGLFDSSFTKYVAKHTNANMLMLKHAV